MLKTVTGLVTVTLLTGALAAVAAEPSQTVIVTASNTPDNHLRVYDTTGVLIQQVPTLGQGGVGGNAGGIATSNGTVAVVNFGSQTVSLLARGTDGFELRQVIPTSSQPVSVAFGNEHLYVLGTATVESYRVAVDGVEAADGTVRLLQADASAAQVGVVGDELLVTEKSGAIERIQLRAGAVFGTPGALNLSPDLGNEPFGFATRGSNAYVTIAGSDLVAVVKDGSVTSLAATGTPGGAGQHSPCWAALAGSYLFTSNTPSRSISRLIAAGRNVLLDQPVAARIDGQPIDIAAQDDLLAVIESNGAGVSHLTQFRIDEDGNLTPTVRSAIASDANGIAIVSGR